MLLCQWKAAAVARDPPEVVEPVPDAQQLVKLRLETKEGAPPPHYPEESGSNRVAACRVGLSNLYNQMTAGLMTAEGIRRRGTPPLWTPTTTAAPLRE